MATRSGTLTLDKIQRIQIYENKKKYKESALKSVLKETGGDMVFNGTLFSWNTYKPLCHCKADGVSLCTPAYTVYGVTWDGPETFREAALPDTARNDLQNYIACVPLIVRGRKVAKLNYQPDMGGKRPRTVIGVKEGRFAWFVTSSKYTPEKLRDLLYGYGWSHATMLDGGGSTCYRDKDGGFVCDSSRRVQHFIVVHFRKGEFDEPKGAKPMVEINAYSKKNDGSKKLSTNFTVKEFACNDGSDAILVAPRLVMVLQSIRSHFGAAVTINSGHRTPAYNAKVGGVETSQHCYGTAADITVKGKTPAQVAAYAREIMPDWGGVGVYDNDAQGHFVHVDVREVRADW